MKIVRQLDETLWRDFVAAQALGNVFHTPEMFEVFARTEGFRPTLWATVSDDGRILALLLPVQIRVLGWLPRRISTRSVVFGSVLETDGAEGQEALDLLLRAYVKDNDGVALFTELRNLSSLDAEQPILLRNGCEREDHLNYLNNLDCSPEELLNNIGHRTRKIIRRGLRAGNVVVEEADSFQGVSACYGLLRKTYAAAHVPIAPLSLFANAYELLHPKGMVRFTLAKVGDVPVATSVELLYKKTVFGWYGGVDRAYGEYFPNELLTWNILEWGAKNGYTVYDFGGAGKPDQKYGVRDFKAKFGGQLVNFGRNTCVHSPGLLKFGKIGYQLLRRFL